MGHVQNCKKKKKTLKKNTFNLPSKVVFVKFLCCWIKDFSIQNIFFHEQIFICEILNNKHFILKV